VRLRAHLIVPVLGVVLPVIIALFFADFLNPWHIRATKALSFSPLPILLSVCLILPLAPALLLNQTRVILFAMLLAASFFIASGWPVKVSHETKLLLLIFMSAQIVILTYLRERGLFTRFGLVRVLLLVLPIVTVMLLDPYFTRFISTMEKSMPWLLSHPAQFNIPYLVMIISLAILALMWRLKGTEYPLIVPAFAATHIAIMLAFAASSPIWSGLSSKMAQPFSLSMAGLVLLWSTYLLSWGRAYRDELTGLPGRRALEEHLAKLSGDYTLVMADVDHFKNFNDKYGHDVGDDVLRMVGQTLQENSPGTAYRFGGEEFTIVVPDMQADDIVDELNSLRKAIADKKLIIRRHRNKRRKRNNKPVSVTTSFGAASRNNKRRFPTDVLKHADRALYKAKNNGRNRVHTFS